MIKLKNNYIHVLEWSIVCLTDRKARALITSEGSNNQIFFLSVSTSFRLSVCLSFFSSSCLFVLVFVLLSVCLSVCLSFCHCAFSLNSKNQIIILYLPGPNMMASILNNEQ